MQGDDDPPWAADLPSGRVYRYRPYQSGLDELRHLLTAGEIRLSNPRRFNDPWDGRPLFDARPDDPAKRIAIVTISRSLDHDGETWPAEKLEAEAKQISAIAINAAKFDAEAARLSDRMQEQLHGRFRLLCLSARPDVQLMWSHYADAHRGICLIFDARNPVIGNARKVSYPETYPELAEGGHPDEILMQSLLNKAAYWKYEHEYRVVACRHPELAAGLIPCDSASYVQPGAAALVGVIVGCRTPEPDRPQLEAMLEVAAHPVELHRAKPNHRDFGLTIERVK
jgi:hypothetical protein